MTRPIWLVVVALGGACDTTATEAVDPKLPVTPTVTSPSNATSLPSKTSCKVEPPITVTLATRALGPDRYELIATATPTKAVDSIILAFDVPVGTMITKRADSFGPTHAGDPRTLVATVTTTARTTELSAFARFPFEGVTMARAATVTVGEARPLPTRLQYTTPDGEPVREVRP